MKCVVARLWVATSRSHAAEVSRGLERVWSGAVPGSGATRSMSSAHSLDVEEAPRRPGPRGIAQDRWAFRAGEVDLKKRSERGAVCVADATWALGSAHVSARRVRRRTRGAVGAG